MNSNLPIDRTSKLAITTSVVASLVAQLALIGTAIAGTPINETRTVSADARIEISNVKGSVNVRGWDRPEVTISGTLGEGSKGLTVDGGSDRLRIKVEPPGNGGWFNWGSSNNMKDSELEIRVPKTVSLKIDVVSAASDVSGISGREVRIGSVSGKIRLDSVVRELSLDSVSGDIEMSGSAESAKFESVSGDIRLRGKGGDFRFDTVSGDVDAELASYREFRGGTVSGDVRLRGQPERGVRVEVETMSGDLTCDLPLDIGGHIIAKTFSGDLDSDFGKTEEPDHGPGRSLDTDFGDGSRGGRFHLETFSGDITIRKQ